MCTIHTTLNRYVEERQAEGDGEMTVVHRTHEEGDREWSCNVAEGSLNDVTSSLMSWTDEHCGDEHTRLLV